MVLLMRVFVSKVRVGISAVAICCVALGSISCTALGFWRKSVRDANEQTLRTDLKLMRDQIRKYAKTRGDLPQTLKDLDADGVFSTVPDPITGRADWQVTIGEDPILKKHGIVDVHSASSAISSDGTPYNTW